jgi:SAM-dependent methyltransferase
VGSLVLTNRKADFISKFVSLGGARLLDFGSGTGPFLLACKDRSLNAVGVECSHINRDFSLAKGLEVFETVQDIPGNDEFDVINLEMCAIYFWDPMTIFKQLVGRLKPGGCLIWKEKDYLINGFNVLNNLCQDTGLQYSSKPAYLALMHFLGMDCIHYDNKYGTFTLVAIKRGDPNPNFKHSYLLFLSHFLYLKSLRIVDPVFYFIYQRLFLPAFQHVFMPLRSFLSR